jgi:CRISPR-associated endonuclease/helicase Cas3
VRSWCNLAGVALDRAFPELARRLAASKPARSVLVKAAAAGTGFADTFVEQASRLSADGAQVVGVVVNRVRLARAIFSTLWKQHSARADVALLIGRTREVDREEVLRALSRRTRAGRDSDVGKPLFVVATQCIEAGADLDFDALVTEIGPLDCPRERSSGLNGAIGLEQSVWAITACTYVVAGSTAGTIDRVRRRIIGIAIGVP